MVSMYILFSLISIFHPIAQASECGKIRALNSRIIGGVLAEKKTQPWVVSISIGEVNSSKTNDTHICGGVLITSEWVLTSAHCLDIQGQSNVFPKGASKQLLVTAGVYSRSQAESAHSHWQQSGVKRFIYHSQFCDHNTYSVNDIALIQLKKPFVYDFYVTPICLPSSQSESATDERCQISGWGSKSENATYYSRDLRQVNVSLMDPKYCEFKYGKKFDTVQHLCAGDWINGNADACKGDSGGPLACKTTDGRWYLKGIVSWGEGCGRKEAPGVYTKASYYVKWMIKVIKHYKTFNKYQHPRAYEYKYTRSRRSLRPNFRQVDMKSTGQRKLNKEFLLRQKRTTSKDESLFLNRLRSSLYMWETINRDNS